MSRAKDRQSVVSVSDLGVRIGPHWVVRGVNFRLRKGEILALVGPSGTGKTTTLQCVLGLHPPTEGSVQVLGQEINGLSLEQAHALRLHLGVLFQRGALFGEIRVFDNVAFPFREMRVVGKNMDENDIRELVMLKLNMVGLESSVAWKMPAELSGGMVKRVALARALALDPEILFLDEPTNGLDPESATEMDNMLEELHRELGVSVLMITHDLNTITALSDRVAVMHDGRILTTGQLEEVADYDDPMVKRFFHGPRGKPLLRSAS